MLDKIKRHLGITDSLQDDLINDLIEDAQSHFLAISGADTVESKYDYIIKDVVILRYNRKGSEGMKTETVDGYSVTYETDDFKKYAWIFERDFGEDGSYREKGKVRFV